jgi:hypothetical protein
VVIEDDHGECAIRLSSWGVVALGVGDQKTGSGSTKERRGSFLLESNPQTRAGRKLDQLSKHQGPRLLLSAAG